MRKQRQRVMLRSHFHDRGASAAIASMALSEASTFVEEIITAKMLLAVNCRRATAAP